MPPHGTSSSQVFLFLCYVVTYSRPSKGKSLLSPSVVNPKSIVPPYRGQEEIDKFTSIKNSIPKHCFQHSYMKSFRYLFVDLAVSAALFFAVSILEQKSFHPAISALLYSPAIFLSHFYFLFTLICLSSAVHSCSAAAMPPIGYARAAFSPEFGSSLTSAATVDSAPVIR
jgi:hypothetical protein